MNGKIIHKNGNISWYKDGKLHREDGPAVILDDGSEEWYYNGERHREDGPAVIIYNHNQSNKLHFRGWYQHGKLHRLDGPARLWGNGEQEAWYRNNKRHREDGPAVIISNDYVVWYLDDKPVLSYEEYQEKTGISDEHITYLKLKWGDICFSIHQW